jgi:hypothetical protein
MAECTSSGGGVPCDLPDPFYPFRRVVYHAQVSCPHYSYTRKCKKPCSNLFDVSTNGFGAQRMVFELGVQAIINRSTSNADSEI